MHRFWFVALLCLCCGRPQLAREDRVQVRLLAHDTSWSATTVVETPDGVARAVPSGREVHVPLGAEVAVDLSSRDYIALFSAPALGLRDFAAPGLAGKLRFHAAAEGSYELRGDELCGLPHDDRSRGRILVEPSAAFRAWLSAHPEGRP